LSISTTRYQDFHQPADSGLADGSHFYYLVDKGFTVMNFPHGIDIAQGWGDLIKDFDEWLNWDFSNTWTEVD